MKLRNPSHPIGPRRQKRSPEMQRVLLLSEPGPWDDANARLIQEPEAVELVRGAVFLLGLFDGAGGQGDGWVEVHGALMLIVSCWDRGIRRIMGDG